MHVEIWGVAINGADSESFLCVCSCCMVAPLRHRYSYDSNPAGQQYSAYNPQNEQGIWPGPDKAFLDALYDDIADRRFGPLNHTHNHMIGFSSGGFFVSRMIAESSGVLKTQTGRPWPEIASAVMLCSGSFETYNGANAPACLTGYE